MPDPSRHVTALLAPALAAARTALRRLDGDEVPAALRRVAAYAGGRLPPPLARKLLEELDGDEWLRDKAQAELDADAEGETADAARLFLDRPPGWWHDLAELAAGAATARADAELARSADHAARLEAKVAEAKRRARAPVEEAPPDDEAVELRSRLKEVRQDSAREVAYLRELADDAASRLREAERDAAEAGAAAQRLREQVRRARRERAAAEHQLMAIRRSGGLGRDPLDLARHLDDLASVSHLAPTAAPAPSAPPVALELPAGVRPDDSAAIDWLVARDSPAAVLVDGYNVSFLFGEHGFASAAARARVNDALGRLATLGPQLRVVVVYDSATGGFGDTAAGPAGVEVVFAAEDLLADDVLVERATSASLPVVVVSSDREVRENAEAGGALALWGEALVAWVRRRR